MVLRGTTVLASLWSSCRVRGSGVSGELRQHINLFLAMRRSLRFMKSPFSDYFQTQLQTTVSPLYKSRRLSSPIQPSLLVQNKTLQQPTDCIRQYSGLPLLTCRGIRTPPLGLPMAGLNQLVQSNSMLTRNNARTPLTLLLALSLLAFVMTIPATVFIVIKQYLGFGIATNPISCTSSQSYFTSKFSQNNYLSSIDASIVIVLLAQSALIVQLIVLRVKLSQADEATELFQSWTPNTQRSVFILIAVASLFLIIPTGYFVSFIVEVTNSCSSSLMSQWIIIAVLTGLALVVHLFQVGIVFRVREHFEEGEPDSKEGEILAEKVSNITNKSIKKEEPLLTEEQGREKIGEQKAQESPESPSNQVRQPSPNLLRPEANQSRCLRDGINQSGDMREPLLGPEEPPPLNQNRNLKRSRASQQLQQQSAKLKQLRQQVSEEEARFKQLSKKSQSRQKEQRKEEKGSNQTIINIHLAPGTAATGPAIVPVVNQQQVSRQSKGSSYGSHNKQSKKRRYGGLGRVREPIYEESSEDSEEHHFRSKIRQGSPEDTHRFYSRRGYEGGEVNPYRETNNNDSKQLLTRHPSQKVSSQLAAKPLKQLSLGLLPSIQISPFPSPQQPTQTIPTSPIDESQVRKVLAAEQKNEKSFFRELEQSRFRQKKVEQEEEPRQPQAPRKGKRSKNNSLDAYIQALNVNMAINRPDFERNFFSNNSEVSYNSVLSSGEKGKMPAEREFQAGREESRGVLPATVRNLLSMTQKIELKYKNR